MYLPNLKTIKTTREYIDTFGGYNHNLKINDNEFYDCINLSSSDYPVLTTREKRGTFDIGTDFKAICSHKYLCAIDGENLVIYKPGNKIVVNMGLTDTPKQMISMGAYLIVMPDKKYINITSAIDLGETEEIEVFNIENSFSNTDSEDGTPNPLIIKLCTSDGDSYDSSKIVLSSNEPETKTNGHYWLDNSVTPNVLKRYDEASSMWVELINTHVKIQATGIGKGFKAGDVVEINGLKDKPIIAPTGIEYPDSTGIENIGGFYTIEACDDDYIVIPEITVATAHTVMNIITVEKKMPEMDFLIEAGNRLWGCRYGYNSNHELVNEIYASKLGDFTNWNSFEGISTDSYIVSLGTNDEFTGAINYNGYPLFFKANNLHKVYGTMPSNYQVQTISCDGVQRGSSNSLVISDNILYFKSPNGICRYDGTVPEDISHKLGDIKYTVANAGAVDGKVYFSMNTTTDDRVRYVVMVYDTKTGIWHKENSDGQVKFCTHCDDINSTNLYYISGHDKIKVVKGSMVDSIDTEKTEWFCETAPLISSTPDHKFISRITIRADLAVGARLKVEIKYVNGINLSSSEWKTIYSATSGDDELTSVTVPIIPRRCDSFKLRFSGEGDVQIFSIAKTINKGTEYTKG